MLHVGRVKVLTEVVRRGSFSAAAEALSYTQSAVSQHLRVLRQAGLVRGERRGPVVHYSLDPDGLEQYRNTLVETLGEDFL